MQDFCEIIYPWGCVDMSTAIARFKTAEGFVVAADRRCYDRKAKTVVSENVQKIFPIEGEAMALTIAKEAALIYPSFQFDFSKEIPTYAKSITGLVGMYAYAAELATRFDEALTASGRPIMDKWPTRFPESETVIMLDGYHSSTGQPDQMEITLYHERPSISRVDVRQKGLCIGSDAIVRSLNSLTDKRLAKYCYEQPETLSDAIDAAKKFIRAHSDPAAELIDPHTYASVGMELNIASITRAEGFRWVPGFEPDHSSTLS